MYSGGKVNRQYLSNVMSSPPRERKKKLLKREENDVCRRAKLGTVVSTAQYFYVVSSATYVTHSEPPSHVELVETSRWRVKT